MFLLGTYGWFYWNFVRLKYDLISKHAILALDDNRELMNPHPSSVLAP